MKFKDIWKKKKGYARYLWLNPGTGAGLAWRATAGDFIQPANLVGPL
jgi:hypothetical protein